MGEETPFNFSGNFIQQKLINQNYQFINQNKNNKDVKINNNENNNINYLVFKNEVLPPPPTTQQTTETQLQQQTINEFYPEYWRELRSKNEFFDGIIELPNGKKYNVHRIVLSSCSDYFKAIFTYNSDTNSSPLSKKKLIKTIMVKNNLTNNSSVEDNILNELNTYKLNTITEVTLDCNELIMETILDYAYTGKCEIDCINIEELLLISDRYQIIGIVKLCCKFLFEQLIPENCIGIYIFSKNYFCKDLENLSKFYILRNFTNVIKKSIEYKELCVKDVINLLSDEWLNVNNELIVFDAIKIWIEYNIDERLKWIKELLPCIRFNLIKNKSHKDDIINWKYIKDLSIDCQDITAIECKPRIPHQVIIVIGGWVQGGPTNIIEVYDSRADMWLNMRHTDTMRAYHGVCVIDQKIYVIGGFNGFTHYNSVRCFDPVEYKWEERACMYHPRCYVSVAVLDRKIYALGGYDGHSRLSSVERYDPDKNQWEKIAPMKKQRSDASATALGGCIYVVGGFNGSEVLNSCEIYNVEENNWTLFSFMISPRSGVSLVACNNVLYAIGGYSGHSRLDSVERYNSIELKWIQVADMLLPRSNFGTAVIEGNIYVIGGYNGSAPISFVEYYNPKEDKWTKVSKMNFNRSAPSACVLRDLTNIKAYSLQCFDFGKDNPCYLTTSLIIKDALTAHNARNMVTVNEDVGDEQTNNNVTIENVSPESLMNNNS